jgi:hypothetical protein
MRLEVSYMLTEGEISQYRIDGYTVPNYRVPNELLESLDEKIAHFLSSHPEYRDNCPALLREDLTFSEYCSIPGILDMVCQLIGPDVALWNMSLFGKPAFEGKATPWHQDGEYWPVRPLATCSVWMAIDDSTIENGCLQVIPGSHRSQSLSRHRHNPSENLTLHEELLDTEFNSANATNIVLERGQISLHDVYLMHGSKPNMTEKDRRGITMRMMPTTSLYDRNVAAEQDEARGRKYGTKIKFSENPILLMRGIDQCGKNEFCNVPAL